MYQRFTGFCTRSDPSERLTMTQPADPRPFYATATAWMADLLAGVDDDQLDNPTPCTDFDVQTLSAHIVGTARRAVALGAGIDVTSVPSIADRHDAVSYAKAVAEAIALWSDDAKLSAMVTVPWGQVPGAGALWGYVNETLVHAWDLAEATGQPTEGDPEAADVTLAVAQRFIPAEIRDDPGVPFAPVVEPRPDAGPTERLANWSGRSAAWR